MPIRLDGTTSSFVTIGATGFPSVTSYTVIFWMQVVTANAGANRTFFKLSNGGEHRIWRPGGNNDGIAIDGTSVGNISANDDESSWQMWALTSAGTGASDGKLYRWKVGDPDATYGSMTFQPSSGFTANEILLGGTYYATGRNARFCYVKIWDAALSLSELQAERVTGSPVRTSNLNRYHRLETNTDTSDYSGNGRTCVIDGATTEGTEPVDFTASAPSLQFFQYDWPHQLHARR